MIEIGHKEARAYDFRNRGASRDSGIQKYGRPQSQGGMGLLVVNPKEESSILKIRYVELVEYENLEVGTDFMTWNILVGMNLIKLKI